MNPVVAVILGTLVGSVLTAVLFRFTSDPFTEAFGDRSWHLPVGTLLIFGSACFFVAMEIPR